MSNSDKKHWLEPPEWWKKFKPLRILAVLGVLFVLASTFYVADKFIAPAEHAEAKRFIAVATDPVPLLTPLASYDTVGAAKEKLAGLNAKSVHEKVHVPPSGKYPPGDRDTLTVSAFKHLGHDGKLTLEFFNDRLFDVTFRPESAVAYAPALRAADARFTFDRTGRLDKTVGHLRLASNVALSATDVGQNLRTKPYVIWQDARLVAQSDEWSRRFVAVPISN